MRFEWFVARRYLRSPYRPAVLRLVTLFSGDFAGSTAGRDGAYFVDPARIWRHSQL